MLGILHGQHGHLILHGYAAPAPTCWGLIFLGQRMDRFAIMVDAGYFLRQAVEIVTAKASGQRNDLEFVDLPGMMAHLVQSSRALLELPDSRELLRVYWYDGIPSNGITPQQRLIMELADVNFRGGTINGARQQKGVDSLIITDLLELAANHAICDAVVITGDSDLAVGIDLSQRKGVRVGVIGLEDLSAGVTHSQSFEITSRADRVGRLGAADLDPFVRHKVRGLPSVVARQGSARGAVGNDTRLLDDAGRGALEQIVKDFVAQQATVPDVVDPTTKRIEYEFDRAFIHHILVEYGNGALTTEEKNFVRLALRRELGVK